MNTLPISYFMDVQLKTGNESLSFDQFFRRHYETVKRWAQHITDNNQDLYEDIVHDIYMRFREQNIAGSDIKSINAYLYATLKNDYISSRRRETRDRLRLVSLIEPESIGNPLFSIDPRIAIKTHDQLLAVCHYVCLRRRTSISASIFILRFFHGYFTYEVARIIKRSNNAVEARLMKARREAKMYLEDPHKFHKILRNKNSQDNRLNRRSVKRDLLSELRQQIFLSRAGICLSESQFRKIYEKDNQSLERDLLGHIVSCRDCLNHINKILNLPLLVERHPLDTLRFNEVEMPVQVKKKAAGAAA